MKKKPHPRWAPKSSPGPLSSDDDSEPPSSLIDTGSGFHGGSPFSHPPSLIVEPADAMPGIQLTPVSLGAGTSSTSCGPVFSPQDPHYLSAYSLPSPPSSPLSASPRPSPRPQIHIITDADSPMNETSHMISNEPQPLSAGVKSTSFEEGLYGHMLDHIMRSDEARRVSSGLFAHDHNSAAHKETCSCIDNVNAYNVLLELSVRLRKAVESLGRVPDHRINGGEPDCQLYAKIAELDKLTSYVLGYFHHDN